MANFKPAIFILVLGALAAVALAAPGKDFQLNCPHTLWHKNIIFLSEAVEAEMEEARSCEWWKFLTSLPHERTCCQP